MAHRICLGLAVGLTALVGCGAPPSDGPAAGPTSSAVDAVSARPATSPASPTAPDARPSGTPSPDNSRAADAAHDSRAQPAASPKDTSSSDEQAAADQTRRAARHQWYADMREAPEAGTRVHALEVWAQQPGDSLEPVSYGLVDEDDSVRARAQQLYEQHLQQEATRGETPREPPP